MKCVYFGNDVISGLEHAYENWGFLYFQGGMKHFCHFPEYGGTKHCLKALSRVRNIYKFSRKGYETFPGPVRKTLQPSMQVKK